MKKFLLLLCIGLAFLSCNKSSDSEPESTANFIITGLRDIDLSNAPAGRVTIPISVVPSAGIADTVSVSVGNLPRGLYFHISPSYGKTPFNLELSFFTDFTGSGGSIAVTVTGTGHSGSRSYTFSVVVPQYKGWKLKGVLYNQTAIQKNQETADENTNIKVYAANGGQLIISFAKAKALPVKTKTYKITGGSIPGEDDIQIGFTDGPQIFNATGIGDPTGTFNVDSLGRISFRCSNVEMSNGVEKRSLDCIITE